MLSSFRIGVALVSMLLFVGGIGCTANTMTTFTSEKNCEIYVIKGFFFETVAKTPNLIPEDKKPVNLPEQVPYFIGPDFEFDYVTYEDIKPYLDEFDQKKVPGIGLAFYPDITGEVIDHLARLKHLKWLDLRGTGVGDDLMDRIAQMTQLEGLFLSGDIIITDKGIDSLLKLKKLKYLGLVYSGITDAGLARLAELKDLENLDVNHGVYEGTFLEALKTLPKLKYLNISDTRSLKEANLAHLAAFKQLKELYLYETQLTAVSTPYLAALPGLTRFALTGVADDKMDYSFLDKMRNLEVLYVRGCKILDAGLEYVAKMKNLNELDIGESAITDDGLAKLKDLTSLQFLALSGNAISDEGFTKLEGLRKLRELDVSDTGIGDESMKLIASNKGLRKMWLMNVYEVTEQGFEVLKDLKELVFLNIYGSSMPDALKDELQYREDRTVEIIDY